MLLLPISVGINIAIAFIFTDSSDLLQLHKFSIFFVLIAAGLRLVPWITKSFRLMNWMHFLGYPFSFRDGLRIAMMTELGAAISPTSIGGEPVKAGILYHRGASLGEAASLTTIAAVENLVFYCIGIPLAFFITSSWRIPKLRNLLTTIASESSTVIPVVVTVAVLMGIVGVVIRKTTLLKGIRKKITSFWNDFKVLYISMIKRGKGRFVINVLLACIHWTARYSVVAVLVVGLGYEVDFVRFFLLQWIVFTLMSLIPTPGATGGAEGLFLILFRGVLPKQSVGSLLLGWRFIDFYFLTIVALIVLVVDSLVQYCTSMKKKSGFKAMGNRLKETMRETLTETRLNAVDKSQRIRHEKDGIG